MIKIIIVCSDSWVGSIAFLNYPHQVKTPEHIEAY